MLSITQNLYLMESFRTQIRNPNTSNTLADLLAPQKQIFPTFIEWC